MLLLIVLVFGYSSITLGGPIITTGLVTASGNELETEIIGPIEDNKSRSSRKRVANFAKKYGVGLRVNEEDVRNEANIIRPCSLHDVCCMREFLADNSDCSIVKGPIPDPLYLAQNTLFFPFLNITLTLENLEITGLTNNKVVEFCVNKKTKKLMMAFEVTNLNETTKTKGYFSYRRKAKESLILADFCTILFKSLTFTIEIPLEQKLRLDLALAHVFQTEGLPKVYLGPKAFDSDDPDVQEVLEDVKKRFPTIIKEAFIFQAPLLTAIIIQNYFCDFKVELISL